MTDRHLDLLAQAGGKHRVGDFLPVHHTEDKIDRFAVRRKRQQDAAIHDVDPAIIDEFGFEADRRAVGDNLKIMVGQARQQRPSRHVADSANPHRQKALLAQRIAHEGDQRILHPAREIEQNGIRPEIGKIADIEILNRRIASLAQHLRPEIIGAHVHAPLIGADLRGCLDPLLVVIVVRSVEVGPEIAHRIHRLPRRSGVCADPRCGG